MADRPNILLITTAEQHHRTLGAYGNPVIHTPNLDSVRLSSSSRTAVE